MRNERYKDHGWHRCRNCGETVYCSFKQEKEGCIGLPKGLCDECFLAQEYPHELKSEQ